MFGTDVGPLLYSIMFYYTGDTARKIRLGYFKENDYTLKLFMAYTITQLVQMHCYYTDPFLQVRN